LTHHHKVHLRARCLCTLDVEADEVWDRHPVVGSAQLHAKTLTNCSRGHLKSGSISKVDIGYRLRVRELLRGAVQLHILFHASLGEIYGAQMAEELTRHGYRISPGSLYPALHKMERNGLLRSHSDVVEGRTRRSYAITTLGQDELRAATAQLRELAEEILGSPNR